MPDEEPVDTACPLADYGTPDEADPVSDMGALYRARLGDCWIEGCLRDAFTQVTIRAIDGTEATGLLCDVHAKEISE